MTQTLEDRPRQLRPRNGLEEREDTRPARHAQRILIVLHDFSGGGTERAAIRLANQWACLGRRVRIFCGSEAGPARRLVGPDVQVEPAVPPIPRGFISRMRLGFALAHAAERFRPDAVFAPGNFHLLVLASFAARDRSGATNFCKISNPLVRQDRRGLAGALRFAVLKALTARVDVLIAMSPALCSEATRLIGGNKISARWEPIFETGAAASVSAVERDPGLIVAVGRLEPQKNFALAVEAMALLSRWTDARLVIFGEGSERARLTRMIARLGLHQRVQLPGHAVDVERWLKRASCYLMTSRYEGYPASLVEALACATPVLVTPCSPALDEILRHATVATVVEPDAGAIAYALQGMLRRPRPQSIDPLLSNRHDVARVARSYLDLIDARLPLAV
ncbi:MAG TPA: glycosyltransferase [Sphingomonas sp.]|nr:glycosyltransferase [Sphingomonas sp.]